MKNRFKIKNKQVDFTVNATHNIALDKGLNTIASSHALVINSKASSNNNNNNNGNNNGNKNNGNNNNGNNNNGNNNNVNNVNPDNINNFNNKEQKPN